MRIVPILLFCVAAWAGTAAFAQGMPPAPPAGTSATAPRQPAATIVAEPAAMFVAACDADGDGRTTRAELVACVARSFAAVDAARTGALGYIGYSDWALRWLGDRNALPSPLEVDADNDDRITLAELQVRFARLFDRFDVDRDGAATRAELLTIRAGAIDERPEGKRGRRGGPAPR